MPAANPAPSQGRWTWCSCSSMQRLLFALFGFFISAQCVFKSQNYLGQRWASAQKKHSPFVQSQKRKGQKKDNKCPKVVSICASGNITRSEICALEPACPHAHTPPCTHSHSQCFPGVPIVTVQAQGSDMTLQCTEPLIKICLSLNRLLCRVADLSN